MVTDRPAPAEGMRYVLILPISGNPLPLALHELPSPDVGVSPTKVLTLSGNDALQKLAEAGFDFETTVIIPDDIEQPLTGAT